MGKTLQEVQATTTSTEFNEWMEYLDREETTNSRSDYYLAQIAAEIRRGQVRLPNSVKLKHFLFEFKEKTSSRQPTQEESKSFWLAGVGLSKKQVENND